MTGINPNVARIAHCIELYKAIIFFLNSLLFPFELLFENIHIIV